MNILSIGNSFSDDAQRYLHKIAKSDGESLTSINLYIGGCPLSRHYTNMLTDSKSYSLEFNGEFIGFAATMKEALVSREWDYITLQQASHQSFDYETYQPYLNALSDYIKTYAPKAKQVIHQTWAYEQGSERIKNIFGSDSSKDMLASIRTAYSSAAKDIGADLIIPSGELFGKLLDAGIPSVHRDTLHASLGLGRYALGLLWYHMLTGNNVYENSFCDFDEPVSEEEISIVKKCIMEVAQNYKL